MLCQRCQTQVATVHLSVVLGQSAEVTQHEFCEACYPAVESERTEAYNSHPSNPLPTDLENITAEEIIAASGRARRNGADKPVLRHILTEVARFPQTNQRLALEVLELAMQSLDRWDEPELIDFATSCWNVIEPQRRPDYVAGLEKLAYRCFEQSVQSQQPDELGRFVLPLYMALTTLARVSPIRFTALVQTLKDRGGDQKLGCRFIALSEQFAVKLNPQ